MKLLRVLYSLLAAAVANFGRLLAGLYIYTPNKFVPTSLFVVVGLLIFITGVLVSIRYLVSVIWLIIAYDPPIVDVPSEKIIATIKVFVVFVALNGITYYVSRPNPAIYKSQIVFKDPVIAVQDSMEVLRQLCESIDTSQFLSCHVNRRDSTLFFSVPVTRNLESLTENLGRIDTITAANPGFRYMKKEDIVRLLSVVRFLNRNLISGIVHDTSIGGYWQYPYGMDDYDDKNERWSRHLHLYENAQDTLKPFFKSYFTILDRKEHLVLTSHKEVHLVLKKRR